MLRIIDYSIPGLMSITKPGTERKKRKMRGRRGIWKRNREKASLHFWFKMVTFLWGLFSQEVVCDIIHQHHVILCFTTVNAKK